MLCNIIHMYVCVLVCVATSFIQCVCCVYVLVCVVCVCSVVCGGVHVCVVCVCSGVCISVVVYQYGNNVCVYVCVHTWCVWCVCVCGVCGGMHCSTRHMAWCAHTGVHIRAYA